MQQHSSLTRVSHTPVAAVLRPLSSWLDSRLSRGWGPRGAPVIVITDYHAVVGGVPGGGCSFARLVLERSPKVVLH